MIYFYWRAIEKSRGGYRTGEPREIGIEFKMDTTPAYRWLCFLFSLDFPVGTTPVSERTYHGKKIYHGPGSGDHEFSGCDF